ncbi:putative cytochrome P450 YjiB [Mycolicibacterium chitae]|uniref:Steroid C26-monooxygenase n=1 Tax=Mycolicibacterium chitae TaxID=1792 RepID=A0A3S4RPV6_MYCCI|nr:cytochrome P450 [Mycolicibacterium chitae]MCV7106822.1 cytochrome P450 [Mycolicibacterium chitae]BBZ00578.1 putative cytochrome P450 YjiB [Mycolicibacterium chitae]BBZ05819.1 putative cytochrome P450 YjiB [Mycolicibacterium chitae]VEG49428.1 cytochrome P450 [Mycolicibacterium chitae]
MSDTTTERTTYPVDAFDPLEPDTMQNPHPWNQTLRAEAPVHFVASRGMWFVTSRELVTEALTNHEVFSSAFGVPQLPPPESVAAEVAAIAAEGWPPVPTLLTADPPEHHYYRRMVAKAFTPRFVAQREAAIHAIVEDLAQQLPIGTPVEFVSAFAAPLPLRIIAHTLNVPDDRIDDFKRWSDQFALTIGAEIDEAGALEQARSLLEYQRYFADQLEQRRTAPQDDLITGLVQASEVGDGDEPLSTGAALSIIQQILIAGNETSTKLMTGMLYQLAEQPKWWDWLRESPAERAAAVVEEGLRFLTPVQSMFRITKADVTLGDTTIPAGSMVVLNFGSANRDETQFVEPEEFDPLRTNAKNHLAFSAGIHACLGAPLARLQARIALANLAGRFRTVQFGPDNDFAYEPSFMLRGFTRLSLVFEAD